MWTSGGHVADLGMLIARTNSDVPKHQGITYFAIDMHQPGVDVRPLREMTGRALFNEVFLTDARVPDRRHHRRAQQRLGGRQHHARPRAGRPRLRWRQQLGERGDPGHGRRPPRARAPATSSGRRAAPAAGGGAAFRDTSKMLIEPGPGRRQVANDPTIRQDLMRLYTLSELGRINNLRVKAAKAKGQEIAGHGQHRQAVDERDRAPAARPRPAHRRRRTARCTPTTPSSRKALDEATGNPFLGFVTEMALFAQAPPIYGGTDQIQQNIIGERVLGLPKEPNQDKVVPFTDLPKNA